MDREKILFGDRNSAEFEQELEKFIALAERNAITNNTRFIYCPCTNCRNNSTFDDLDMIREHLFRRGFDPSYKVWIWHGEDGQSSNITNQGEPEPAGQVEDGLDEMVQDILSNFCDNPSLLASLVGDSEKPLYPNCEKYTRLSAVFRLYHLKAANGWTDVSFTKLLTLLKDMLPKDNVLPDRTYAAKKVLCPMKLAVRKIDACPKDCVLYRKEYAELKKCPKCGTSRYKKRKVGDDGIAVVDDEDEANDKQGIPMKKMWYFPVFERLKRLFGDVNDAKQLAWHANRGIPEDSKLKHISDGTQWKKINTLFSFFGDEARNIRFGLCTDGMNPYGALSSQHSSWPVMLMIYNLPPWLCMKRKFILLSTMISGPKQPGNDIDVYLAPLVDELKELWSEGKTVYDAYQQASFTLRAMIFCTITDFPGLGNLSGYPVKGHKACPICGENTDYCQLEKGHKTVYLGHRRFLPMSHPYRRMKKAFNGKQEFDHAPIEMTAEKAFEQVRDISAVFGKFKKPKVDDNLWKKKSILYQLYYWTFLDIKHCLDVMHIEKNICESLIGTLLNIPGKTKDGYSARLDLQAMGLRPQLAPEKRGNRTFLPPACFTMSKLEKTKFCKCLKSAKVPAGYSSNISRCVSMEKLTLMGLKSHDCHVLMQQLLPVAIRSILPGHVRKAITKLCFFYKEICSKAIDNEKLDELQKEVIETLCQLEIFFPPAFFDIMLHLTVHLVREIKILGPIYLHWMYPFERNMKVYKGYVRNMFRPDASIVEGYSAEEATEFCTSYCPSLDSIGLPKSRFEQRKEGSLEHKCKPVTPSNEDLMQAHLFVLRNTDDMTHYVNTHMKEIEEKHNRWSQAQVLNEHNRTFIKWFNDTIAKNPEGSEISDTVRWLAYEPRTTVLSYRSYDANGYTFCTKRQDDKSTTQNSGVTVFGESLHMSSARDKNMVYATEPFYGIVQDIWELDYVKFKVPLFRCKWVDNSNGVRSEPGFILVDLNKEGSKKDQFILASQAHQVFYVNDPCDERWSVVLPGRKYVLSDEDEVEKEIQPEDLPQDILMAEESDVESFVARQDHDQGIYVDDLVTNKRKRTD